MWWYFKGVIGIYLSSLKRFFPDNYSLRNASASKLGSDVKETGIWHSPGAMLTMPLTDMFGPWPLSITVGKGKEDFFNFLCLCL